MAFMLMIIMGLAVLPLLNVQLNPSRSLPGLSVTYRWSDASARVIEQEVTSRLEGLFSSVKGYKETITGPILDNFIKNCRYIASILCVNKYFTISLSCVYTTVAV
jgi:hypothetical protein